MGRLLNIARHHYSCFTCSSASYRARMRQAAATNRFSQAGLRFRRTEREGWRPRRLAGNRAEGSIFFSETGKQRTAITRFGGQVCLKRTGGVRSAKSCPAWIFRERILRESTERCESATAGLRRSDWADELSSRSRGSAKCCRLPEKVKAICKRRGLGAREKVSLVLSSGSVWNGWAISGGRPAERHCH